MTDWLIPALTLLLGASGAGTYFATRNQVRFDIDSRLRDLRIASYKNLWSHLMPLAKYARPRVFDVEKAAGVAEDLRRWYFEDGGIYLTVTAREQYFALQNALARIAEDQPWEGVWTTSERRELVRAAWEHLRVCGSSLRTGLTRDIGTRDRPRFPGGSVPFDRALAAGMYASTAGEQIRLGFDSRPLSGHGPRIDTIGGPRTFAVLAWSPSRATIRLRVTQSAASYERQFLVEGRCLVEGPVLEDVETTLPPLLWNRVANPTPALGDAAAAGGR